MDTKTTPQPPKLTDTQIQIYHSTLYLIEGLITKASKSKDFLKSLQNIETTITNLPDFQKHPDLKNSISALLNENIEKIKNNRSSKQSQEDDLPSQVLQNIRKKRKDLDYDYIKSLFSKSKDSQTEQLNQTKQFMQAIKKEDPEYYDTLVFLTLKAFRDIPIANQQEHVYDQIYVATKEQKNYINNAKECINAVLPDYELVHETHKEKDYALRYFDRALFNGCLEFKDKVGTKDFKETSSTAEKSLEMLEKLTQKEGPYHGDTNAEIIITCLKYVMKKYNLEKEPFPVLSNKLIKEITRTSPNKTHVYFHVTKRDQNNKKVYKDHVKQYMANTTLTNFYRTILREQGELSKYKEIEPAIKYREKKDDLYLTRICLAAKESLIKLCKQHNVDENIINLAFSDIIFDDKGNVKKDFDKDLYVWLTKRELKDEKLKESGGIFIASRHHDRKQVNFSPDPNKDPKNIILTLHLNTDVKPKAILRNIINYLKNVKHEDEKLFKALTIEEEKLKQSTTEAPIDIHGQILHDNVCLVENHYEQGALIDHYFLSPRKLKKTKTNPDTDVVALISADTQIHDQTGQKELTPKEKAILKAQQIKALKILREKGK